MNPLSLEPLGEAVYGPFRYRLELQKVSDYVAATFDEPERWRDHAPPSIAGAALFAVAPHLLSSPAMVGNSVIHGDQSFSWHGPIPIGPEMEVGGRVARIRERGGVWFVAFEFEMVEDGRPLVTGTSTFLVSALVEPDAGSLPEPPLEKRGANGPLEQLGRPPAENDIPPLERSASRMDLVVYAAASGDFNPIHWDHQVAAEAGLPGVVVHGLLQSAWLCQAAGRHTPGPYPLASARFRYRSPLRPGLQATVTGRAKTTSSLALELEADGEVTVAAAFELPTG